MKERQATSGVGGHLARTSRWRFARTALAALWIFAVTLLILWDAYTYSGIFALFAEWQYDKFGHHFPALSFLLLLSVYASPALIVVAIGRRRFGTGRINAPLQAETTVANTSRLFLALSAGLAAAALAVLCFSLLLPRVLKPDRLITLGTPASQNPGEGNVALQGEVLYDRTSAFAQNLLIASRGVRFAPMIASGASTHEITYFVELLPSERAPEATERFKQVRAGYLLTDYLPGSILRLYRYAGHDVHRPYHVLYASTATIRAPFFVTSVQLMSLSLMGLVAALLQGTYARRQQKLERAAPTRDVDGSD